MHYSYWNKILWLLTSALLGEELTFKRRSMRKQLLIPKSQHPFLSLSRSPLEKYPTTHPPLSSSLEGEGKKNKKTRKTGTKHNLRKHARSKPMCCWRPQHTASCIMWRSSTRPGLTAALGRRRLFLCVLMRHHEGRPRVKISGRPATYSTALGTLQLC